MSKHTEGPWTIETDPRENLTVVLGGENDTTVIVRMPANHFPEANARLIAASPDLLRALRMARTWVAGFDREDRAKADLSVIDAAIEKAEGT